MNQSPSRAPLASPWLVPALFGLALVVRIWGIWEWSLWEDEETTVYFSYHLEKWFPRAFPIYFTCLRGVFSLFGVSEAAGRALAGAFGLATIWVVYITLRRFYSRATAVVAVLFLSINLGHVFWSQCVRYYTAVCFFQSVSILFFLEGFEGRKSGRLVLSNVALVAALLSHQSAILLAPVHIGYLMLMLIGRPRQGAYNWRGYLAFGLPLAVVLAGFALAISNMESTLGVWRIPSARDPLHVVKTVVAYFGLPLCLLAPLGSFARGSAPRRVTLYFVVAAFIPVLELAVIAALDRINVTWYYALFAVLGFVVLSSLALVDLHRRGWSRTAVALGSGTVIYYVFFFALYVTVLHGDRPRWRDASEFVRDAAGIVDVEAPGNPRIHATVPGVVAFYLGVDPAKTMGHPLVVNVPADPPGKPPSGNEWHVVKATHISPPFVDWYREHCTEEARFEAGTSVLDRTVVVYSCRPPAGE